MLKKISTNLVSSSADKPSNVISSICERIKIIALNNEGNRKEDKYTPQCLVISTLFSVFTSWNTAAFVARDAE